MAQKSCWTTQGDESQQGWSRMTPEPPSPLSLSHLELPWAPASRPTVRGRVTGGRGVGGWGEGGGRVGGRAAGGSLQHNGAVEESVSPLLSQSQLTHVSMRTARVEVV